MNNFKRLNTFFGWGAFLFALIVYILTLEPTGSLWDCGEFISAAFRLQVVHPPGAPLFLLIGRLFTILGGGADNAAIAVNLLSGLSSALCVMFTFWITTYFGKRIVEQKYAEPKPFHYWGILVSGLVAAGTLTFSDTFWFSAVEAEVYAMSSFFMAFTFWCIIKWERVSDTPMANKWLIFIGYVVGLAIGVHLLNLLVIPGITLVYYFKKYKYSSKGLIGALAVGFFLLFLVQLFIIPGIPSLAAWFDKLFVNKFDMGFGSGVIFFSVLMLIFIIGGIFITQKKGKVALNTAFLAFAFMIIGYSSYAMVVIRSQANTPIDMNNPEDPLNLVYYLNREQYGDRPLLNGPHFMTRVVDFEKKDQFSKGEERYERTGYKIDYKYDKKDQMFFPRIYDGNDQTHVSGYRDWANIPEGKEPTMGDNMKFFFRYQMGHMYWRYFFWNFAGRQNDDQGMRSTDVFDGNWISGIRPLDAIRLGPQSNLPDSMSNNPSRNTYFMLPFILGILGLVLQFKGDKYGSLINSILFLVTGLVLIIYLNPPPYEPRERDYVFVGSFQVFSTWVGLGVLGLLDLLLKYLSGTAALAIASTVGVLGAPTLMGTENWDDHDRSGRYMSTDFAKNYLKSCGPNGILFTNGDNDTYPLWYMQNVEGYRTDVRVVNLSLLNAGDYAVSLKRQEYASEPFEMTFTNDQLENAKRDRIMYDANRNKGAENNYYNLKQVLKAIATDNNPRFEKKNYFGELESVLPTKNLVLMVDKQKFIANDMISMQDTGRIVDQIRFQLPGNGITRSDLVLLDVVANNFHDRPIHFTTTTGVNTYAGLQDYFMLDGLTYRLMPVYAPADEQMARNREYGYINYDRMYSLLVDSFTWGGMETDEDMWVDDKMRLVPRVMRQVYIRVAGDLVAQGDMKRALTLLQTCEKSIPNRHLPYDGTLVEMVNLYYQAKDKENAQRLLDEVIENQVDWGQYLKQFKARNYPVAKERLDRAIAILNYAKQVCTRHGDLDKAQEIDTKLGMISG